MTEEIKQEDTKKQEQEQVKNEIDQQISKSEELPQEKPEDPNWRAFREARKKDRIEKEEALRKAAEKQAEIDALKAAMEAAFSRNQPQQQNYFEPTQETDDERIEKKVAQILAQKEAASAKERAEREAQEMPQRLQQVYGDFGSVVNAENLDYLEYHYPEVAGPLRKIPESFDKWSDIYKAVKKFVPNHASAKKEAERADQNFSKPKSISAVGMNPPTDTKGLSRLSDERKAANWERMQKLLKSV